MPFIRGSNCEGVWGVLGVEGVWGKEGEVWWEWELGIERFE